MREKEENRRTQELFVGNLKKKKVLFNERTRKEGYVWGQRVEFNFGYVDFE